MSSALQVDIRHYFVVGGHKPVDQSLAERVLSVLSTALSMDPAESLGAIKQSGMNRTGNFASGPSLVTPAMAHVLGPLRSDQARECGDMVFSRVRAMVGSKEEHCASCVAEKRCRTRA